MYSKEAFEAMKVVDLRAIARENHVTLSAGISKQGIVDRLCAALIKPEEEETPEAEQPATPIIRRVASIVSDDDDTPVLTPNVPFNRNSLASSPAAAVQRPAVRPSPAVPQAPNPGQPTVNRGNIPGTNKPVFSLEGVRAWHNPRTYQQQQSNSPFTQRAGAGFSQQHSATPPYGQQRNMQRPAPTVSRFGPDSSQADAPAADAPAPSYRNESRSSHALPPSVSVLLLLVLLRYISHLADDPVLLKSCMAILAVSSLTCILTPTSMVNSVFLGIVSFLCVFSCKR